MGVALEFRWHVVLDGTLDCIDILAGRDPRAVADTEDMRIDRLGRMTPPHVQDDIGGLSADARQGLQGGPRGGNFAVVLVDKDAREPHDVLGLVAIEPDRPDVLDEAVLAEIQHFPGCVRDLEEFARGLVDTSIRCLGGKGHGHDERVGVDVLKFAFGLCLSRAEPREDLDKRLKGQLLGHGPRFWRNGELAASVSRKMRVVFCLTTHKFWDRMPRDAKMNDMSEPETGYHYQLVRRAIELIDAGARDLSLEEIASEMHMSPAHFQRIFSRWVGVSPKRYQQWLKLDHAKALLAGRHTTLETADEVGLSGSGRLHDLFVRWEAMSPGDYARGGGGLEISWGWFGSPFGPALVMGTARGICGIGFAAEAGAGATMADLRARWPMADYQENPAVLAPVVASAFPKSGRTDGPVPLFLIGAPFQIKVWEALLHIPTGRVTTYSDIARVIGAPKAVRAVGTAVGRNPISWLIPCHRALRKSGGLGGYHWGLPVKRAMLAWESAVTA